MAVAEMERVATAQKVNMAAISPEVLAEAIRLAEEHHANSKRITILEAFDTFIRDEKELKGLRPKSIKHWHDVKKQLLIFWGGGVDKNGIKLGREIKYMNDITIEDIRALNNYLLVKLNQRLQPIAQDTRRIYMTYLQDVLEWCHLHEYKVLKPKLITLPKHGRRKPLYLNLDEFKEFMEAVGRKRENVREIVRRRNIAICQLFFSSGIRLSELRALNRNDIKDRQFVVEADNSKNGEARVCFVSNAAMRAIEDYLELRTDNCNALFVSSQSPRRLSASPIEHIFQQARRECHGKVSKTHPHALRHSFATFMYRNDVDIYLVSKMLGHQSLDTTKIYTHLEDPDLRRAHSRVMSMRCVANLAY